MSKALFLLGGRVSTDEFDAWISEYHGMLYRHALWMTGNQDLAQDVTQETYYQAWNSRSGLKDKDKVYPWLLTILRRTIYREQRYMYKHAETMASLGEIDQGNSQDDASSLLQLYKAFECLSPKMRETFLLHNLHGFSYEEISQQLEIPIGTVMSRVSRAREALQNQYQSVDDKVINLTDIKREFGNE